ncbi:MAG: DUF2231 domain-containing protein [Actinomycetota bacterium]
MVTVITLELENLFGLPAHPLLVHLPVVMVPIAAAMAIAMTIRSAWLDRFGWWLVGTSGLGFVGAILAAGSGEALEERVRESEILEHHTELGETARLVAGILFVIALLVVGTRHWMRKNADKSNGVTNFMKSKVGVAVVSAALVVSAGAAAYTMVDAGHQGAKASWHDVTTGEEKRDKGDHPDDHDEEGDGDEAGE